MADHSVHKASDLAGDERVIIERWLGRVVSNDETMTAYRPHIAPDHDKRQSLRRNILAQAHEIGSRAGDISEQEIEDLLGGAFADVRGRHQ